METQVGRLSYGLPNDLAPARTGLTRRLANAGEGAPVMGKGFFFVDGG